jgi:O-antigen/teichoic acid export membrane protein
MTMFANLCLTAFIFLWGGFVLRLWVGAAYADSALPILKILALAQTLRLMCAPFSVMLVSVGEQHRAISPTICEAIVNLLASVVGMWLFGPVGVAWGTLVGAIFGVLWVLTRTMPSVTGVRVVLGDFLVTAVLPGVIPCLPLAMLWLVQGYLRPSAYWISLGICVVLTATLWSRYSKSHGRSSVA